LSEYNESHLKVHIIFGDVDVINPVKGMSRLNTGNPGILTSIARAT
jgi:hypothetical protein